MTNTQRSFALLLVLALIVAAVSTLESIKVRRAKNVEVVEVTAYNPATGTTTALRLRSNGGSVGALGETPLPRILSTAEKKERFEIAKEITTPDGFINTANKPISLSDSIGRKVVLLDFWTYTCINCQRTLPYLESWWRKYRDKGLLIIGIHTPEFSFERKYQNVADAVKRHGLTYPVVLDNDYSTWSAYRNRGWPSKYLIDIDGFIVYRHIGEGAYEETEQRIREALEERAYLLGITERTDEPVGKPTDRSEVDFGKLESPETYFGALRNENFGSGKAGERGEQTFLIPASVKRNTLYLAGTWNIEDEYAENLSRGARIVFRYKAKNVYLVARADNTVKVKVLLDGRPAGALAGVDVSKDSLVVVKEDRLYKLIEGEEYIEHTLELIIESPDLKAYTFTFG